VATAFGTPFISGKDSLNSEYTGPDGQRHAIPPTLLISALGLHPDVTRAVTMDLKQAGSSLYLLGTPQQAPLERRLPEWAPRLYRTVHRLMGEGRILACHDASEGGLALASAEMARGGGLDLDLELTDPCSERPCRLLVETREELHLDVPCQLLGRVL
jgi:phosphoribosylformylglycinamidine synthase